MRFGGKRSRKNVYADDILSGIQKVAKKKRIEVAIASSVNELIALCKKHGEKTAAVICYSKAIALEIVEKLHRENIHPILTYIHTLDTAYPYSCVVQDYACSFHRLLSAAIKSGVKRIAFVGSNEDSFSDSVRKNILLKTAREQGLYCKIFQNNGDVGGCIGEFLAEAEDFDSIVCANDIVAVLLSADRLDLTILKSVLNNEKYANIEEENYLAINTIKYRMNNMIKNAGVKNRKELLDLIGKYNLKF